MVKSPNLILTVIVRAPSSLPRRWDAAASTIRVKWPRMTSGSHKSDGNVSSWPIDFALWSGMTCRASSPRHNPARCEPCAFPRCRWSVAVGRDARSPTVRTPQSLDWQWVEELEFTGNLDHDNPRPTVDTRTVSHRFGRF